MAKIDNPQLELFSQPKESGAKPKVSASFLLSLWKYEKTILVVIFFIITSVISFSFGVEKGRKLVVILPEQPKTAPQVTPQVITAASVQAEPAKKILGEASGYTIQVASYRTKKLAQKEAKDLTRGGFQVLVLPKGQFVVVCVGSFSDKKAAEVFLPKLKNKYNSSYVRRL